MSDRFRNLLEQMGHAIQMPLKPDQYDAC
ncbi:MAG: hypothetical protein RL235_1055, partial [Chlamydiota bacterium]